MRLAVLFFVFVMAASPALAFEDPFAAYEAGMYKEVRPSNPNFFSTYYKNKIKKVFREFEEDEDKLLIDASSTVKGHRSVNIASPVIHPDSKVKQVYINNEMQSDIYVKY
jgi:hypothetical protein